IILGVEEFEVAQSHMADLALAFDPGQAEIGKAAAAKFGEFLQRLAFRLEHRLDEMHPAALVGEDLGEEQALIDLVAFLGDLLHQRAFLLDHLGRRQERRIAARSRGKQFGHAQGARAAARYLVVDRDGMMSEEPLLDGARALLDGLRFGPALAFALSAWSEPLQRRFYLTEGGAGSVGVARQRLAEGRFGLSRAACELLHGDLPDSAAARRRAAA